MAVTHMTSGTAEEGFALFCGIRRRPALKWTLNHLKVTCIKCQISLRWLIVVKGMTWEEACRAKKREYEANREERAHMNCRRY